MMLGENWVANGSKLSEPTCVSLLILSQRIDFNGNCSFGRHFLCPGPWWACQQYNYCDAKFTVHFRCDF